MTFAEYPLIRQTFVTAFYDAIQESLDHPDHFIYLFHCADGYYLIDWSKLNAATNDKLQHTFRNGEKTL